MLQHMSRLMAADNSGAKILQVIGVPGTSKHRTAGIGNLLTVTIKSVKGGAFSNNKSLAATKEANKVKVGDIYQALVIRTRKEFHRPDGRWLR